VEQSHDFRDHGVGAAVAESRGVVAAQDAMGRPLVLALSMDYSPRGWILVTDVDRGEAEQVYYPDGVPNSPPYASLLSRNGRFYTFAGATLLEFDITARKWLFHGVPAPGEECYTGSAMADGPDGRIYAGSCPHCRLVSFDPQTKEMKDYGPLDPEEHYTNSLILDSSGWVYAGIGTARQNVVTYNPRTGECVPIAKEEDRVLGTGEVYLGQDGKVYGRAGESWYRMSEGRAEDIAGEDAAPDQPTGAIGWGNKAGVFPDGRALSSYNLPERWLEVEGPETDRGGVVTSASRRRITFDYLSEGAGITTLAGGPDGKIYASSCHPMHFIAYDPGQGQLEDWGPIPRVGGGNFCAMAVLGPYVFAAAYCGGFFYQYDTRRPWNNETGEDPNPRLIAQFNSDITRPRACIAHTDGRHVIMSGFAGYGMCGGGLGLYDVETARSSLITHEQIIPYHSTLTMEVLPSGDLLGGTSVLTPGGGHPQAQEAVLYVMDWKARRIVFQAAPVPGAAAVLSTELGPDGRVYGLAAGSIFFVFDLGGKEVIHREDLSSYGDVPKSTPLVRGPDGHLYAAFTDAIVRIDPGTLRHEKLAAPPVPISAGIVSHRGRLYFASGSHVWSLDLASQAGSPGADGFVYGIGPG